jgi:hypothetical protein
MPQRVPSRLACDHQRLINDAPRHCSHDRGVIESLVIEVEVYPLLRAAKLVIGANHRKSSHHATMPRRVLSRSICDRQKIIGDIPRLYCHDRSVTESLVMEVEVYPPLA